MTEAFEFTSGAIAPVVRSAAARPNAGREPIKHLLIGSPPAIRTTIHRLHQLRYADAGLWSTLLTVPERSIIITPNPGDAMSILVRYLQIE